MISEFSNIAAIVLAAGESTRFNYGKPAPFQKVMLKIGGKPMISYVIEILTKLRVGQIVLVVGHRASEVKRFLGEKFTYALQRKRLGTGDAVRVGLKKIDYKTDTVMVVNGDDSFRYKLSTIDRFIKYHFKSAADLTFITTCKDNPTGLGRVVRDEKSKVIKVVEEKDATAAERLINEVNCGAYLFKKEWLIKNIDKIVPSPVTGEYYLVNLIEIAGKQDKKVAAFKLLDPSEWFGVNTPAEFENAVKIIKS